MLKAAMIIKRVFGNLSFTVAPFSINSQCFVSQEIRLTPMCAFQSKVDHGKSISTKMLGQF